MNKELKPCPFCGSKNIMLDVKERGYGEFVHIAFCNGCGASGPEAEGALSLTWHPDEQSAVAAWNKRVE